MSNPSLAIVLAEDERHQRFVRQYLYKLGLSAHQIRMEPLPAGKGCGEQWVRDRYPGAVEAYRSRSARAKTTLVVVIDADTGNVQDRHSQLRTALSEKQLPGRSDGEAIAHLVPRRSIETWVFFLSGRAVDEATDYSKDPGADELIRDSARKFYELSRPNCTMPNCIPSLSEAVLEVRRLE